MSVWYAVRQDPFQQKRSRLHQPLSTRYVSLGSLRSTSSHWHEELLAGSYAKTCLVQIPSIPCILTTSSGTLKSAEMLMECHLLHCTGWIQGRSRTASTYLNAVAISDNTVGAMQLRQDLLDRMTFSSMAHATPPAPALLVDEAHNGQCADQCRACAMMMAI